MKPIGVSHGLVFPLVGLIWLRACALSNGAIYHVKCHIWLMSLCLIRSDYEINCKSVISKY